jgi:small subunit ribosomal protein S9
VGMLLRDPRQVERKKPGQKGARRKFQWVRR